jgi:hypothetical protein
VAPVDIQDGTVDETRGRCGEEDDRASDLVGIGETAQGKRLAEALGDLAVDRRARGRGSGQRRRR